MKKITAMLLALGFVISSLAACGSAEQTTDTLVSSGAEESGAEESEAEASEAQTVADEGPKYGGHLNVHVMYNCNNIDYMQSLGVWGYLWANVAWENILTRDADYNIAPGVCDYELSEDKLTLKLWVREGAKFHDGSDVDIYDIEASLNRFLKGYSSAKTHVTPYVDKMTVDGDTLTLTFTEYREKCMYYLANTRTWCAVIPKEIYEKYGTGVFTSVEDAIGTGPYKITNFVQGVRIDVERFEDYVPCEEGRSGMAAPKMAYLDSITFFYNSDYSSATMAMLSGEYDVTDVIESDYVEMAEAQGIYKYDNGPTVTGLYVNFNTYGTNNICAQYPALRKAIMAAIDYEQFTEIYSDGGTIVDGNPTVLTKYQNDILKSADYAGAANVELAQQYLAEAEAAGYKGEPVELVATTSAQEVEMLALLGSYLDAAGINYDKNTMESVAYTKFINSAENNWDMIIHYPLLGYTPGTLHDMVARHYWNNAQKDVLLEQLAVQDPDSAEYMETWEAIEEMMVEDCPNVHLGTTHWIWYHSDRLHTNDEGAERYFFNAYWDDPEAHVKKD